LLTERKVLVIVAAVATALLIGASFVYIQVSELQNQVSKLQAQNSDLHEQVSELQDQNTELQNQTSELKQQLNYLQNQTYRGLDVEITEFEWIGGFSPVVGLLIGSRANVTVQNNEAYAIGGLKLDFTLIRRSSGAELGLSNHYSIDTLQAGESREINGEAYWDLGNGLDNAECVVVLRLGNFVVDKKTFPLS
jgi:cell division protein FtsL